MSYLSILAGVLFLLAAVGAISLAEAQTTTTVTTTSTTPPGTFTALSPGGQKIAQALFQAEQANVTTTGSTGGTTGGGATSGTTGGTTTKAPTPLTLDQIAALKQSGQGWGQIFHTLQAQGLVQEKNLGQVVSQYQHQVHATSHGVVTTASNRVSSTTTVAAGHGGKSGNGDSGGSSNGGGGESAGVVSAGGSAHGNAFGHSGGGSGGHGR